LYLIKAPFLGASFATKLIFVGAFTTSMFALSVAIAIFFEHPARIFVKRLKRLIGFAVTGLQAAQSCDA